MPTKKIEEAEEVTRCPECNSGHLSFDYERGELICEECGLVLTDQMIDQGPEWRAFDVEQGEKRARTGAPMTYTIHDKGLSTTIGWKNKDSYGKSIPTRNRAQLYRLRKWQRRIRVSNATERNLAFALSELDRMASGMGLPRNVRETAAMVYRKAVNKNLIQAVRSRASSRPPCTRRADSATSRGPSMRSRIRPGSVGRRSAARTGS